MLSALLITWLLILDQQMVSNVCGYYVKNVHSKNTNKTLGQAASHRDPHTPDAVVIYDDAKDKQWKPSPSDVIELNVGGQKIATLRSTLTAIPNSKLALLFTDIPETNHSSLRGKASRKYFFDYNPEQFTYLLDQLRAIKRQSDVSGYELNLVEPNIDVPFDFSVMLAELGLNPERFLSPLVGTHLNLKIDSLIGWKECHRSQYNVPFDISILNGACNGKRLLVACRSVDDQNILTVAGVGQRQGLFHPCHAYNHCRVRAENETGFYYVADRSWGFVGSPDDDRRTVDRKSLHKRELLIPQPALRPDATLHGTFFVNPCDTSDLNSDYRLCWSLHSDVTHASGDRCGSTKDIHDSQQWERLIYQPL